jgi:hypothetical protein
VRALPIRAALDTPTRQPVGFAKTRKDFVLPFNARAEGIADGADHIAPLADNEHIGQTEVAAALVALGCKAGLECCEQRSSELHIGAEPLALFVAQ